VLQQAGYHRSSIFVVPGTLSSKHVTVLILVVIVILVIIVLIVILMALVLILVVIPILIVVVVAVCVVQWAEFLAASPEAQCSIPGTTKFSAQQWVWNGVHSAS
jgi:hypothetical protein